VGSIHKDIHKTEITHDTIHAYTDAGIAQLLSDVYKLANDAEYRGDTEAIVLKVDLEHALQSDALTPRQRQAVALYYFCQLTQQECAKVLGVKRQRITDRLKTAKRNIAQHMQGDDHTSSQYINSRDYMSQGIALDYWNYAILHNDNNWWVVNDTALVELNSKLGMPPCDNTPKMETETVRCYTDKQLERRFANEIPRPDVYPVFDNTGRAVDESGIIE
jgi:predicted DNA-binding protein (UPF0251 family)